MPDTTTRPWLCPQVDCPASTHDTYSALRQGCDSLASRVDRSRYVIEYKEGVSRLTGSVGLARRIEACHYMGWTGPEIARELGVSRRRVNELLRNEQAFLRASTPPRMVPVLERLAMTPTSDTTIHKKTRTWARGKGFRHLLAWDDIDDPAERPGEKSESDVVADQVLELAGQELPTLKIAAKLDITVAEVDEHLSARFAGDLAAGMTHKEIAAKHGVTAKRVSRHARPIEVDEFAVDAVLDGRRHLLDCSDAEAEAVVERVFRDYLGEGWEQPGLKTAERLEVEYVVVRRIRDRLAKRRRPVKESS